jgi:hypothetical protein
VAPAVTPPWTVAIVVVLVALGMFLRFQKLHDREFPLGDEKPQIDALQSPFGVMIHQSLRIVQFPGDMLLVYPFYKLFGVERWALAFPHMALTLLGFYLLYRIGQRYFRTLVGYLITFLIVDFNQNLVFHAFEIRPYGVLVTLALGAFLAARAMVEIESPSRSERIGFSLVLFITLLFHFYGGLMLFFAYGFHLLASRRKESLGSVLARNIKDYGLGFGVAAAVWSFFVFAYDKSYLGIFGTFNFIPKGVLPIMKAVFGNLVGFKPFYFFLAGFLAWVFLPRRERWAQIMFFLLLVAAPVSAVLLLCVLTNYYFVQRLFVWVMPFFALLLGWQWDSLIHHLGERRKAAPAEEMAAGVSVR